MGSRGPVPKPDAQRAGHRAKSDRATKVAASGRTVCPDPDSEWHPKARRYFDAAVDSVVSAAYEPSDWASLLLLCDLLSRYYTDPRPSAEMFKHAMGLSARLLLTPADRLRARIEVDHGGGSEEPADDASDAVAARFAALRAVGEDA